jgi:DNA polymerase I
VTNLQPIVVCDFEYEVTPGNLPEVLCMVAHILDENLQNVRVIRKWRGEFDKAPPFDIGENALFVAYGAWAEMTCFSMLGWRFPVHIFDLHTAYLAASNILLPCDSDETQQKPRKRLSDACRAYGIEGWQHITKKTIARDIGEGRWQVHGREAVLMYCEEDVCMAVKLLRAQLRPLYGPQGRTLLPAADVPRLLWWSN